MEGLRLGVFDRLHKNGHIEDPVSRAEPVVLTEEGLAESKRLFETLFVKQA